MQLTEIRLRTQRDAQNLSGYILQDDSYDLLLAGPSRVLMPNNKLLCIYLPGVIQIKEIHRKSTRQAAVPNELRPLASGGESYYKGNMKITNRVRSGIMGYMEHQPGGLKERIGCRVTVWTGKYAEEFEEIKILTQQTAKFFKEYVPDRYAIQMKHVLASPPEFVITNTPFSTLTANRNFPTGVHKDRGDLESGFSCLLCMRQGSYTGGHLVFPEWRVGVDMQDGDLMLMDAHQWHGNTMLNLEEDGERLSLVHYYRTKIRKCPSTSQPTTDTIQS